MEKFKANCLPVLIGSLPINDHDEAISIVYKYTPDIPLWVQLPIYKQEGMIAQFLPGLPSSDNEEIAQFYEEYLAVSEGQADINNSRFAMSYDYAKGFFVFLDYIKNLSKPPIALKGQITCPITLGMGTNDENGRAVYYNDILKDPLIKLVSMKAKWQAKKLSQFGLPVIIFLDAPAIAGFGSSAYISISREEIVSAIEEVISAIHSEGALVGVHICANADWSIVLNSSADIVSFDAYSFFDRFILYPKEIKAFLERGSILAWGIVPTGRPEFIEKENTDSLFEKFNELLSQITKIGISQSKIFSQSLITPSCGTGSLSIDNATKVLRLTRELSDRLRGV
ncbi:MAG: hypothetical protein HQK78_08215 [Desulfobacterales bacterium]|nr:hypothetical protein [Desulfobacterales bacterium]